MKMTLIRCGAVAGTCLAAGVAFGVTEWPLERLQLAAGYFDGPAVRTEQNVREMREAGIDLLIHSRNGDTNTFALLEKYGIRTVLNDLCDNIVMGPDKVGRQHELYPPAWYARQAKRFVDAPAIVGIDAGDEPSALDFPYLGEVIGQVSELFPGKYPYFNIYPNYASLSGLSGSVVKSQLGTATYEEHVAAYLKHMPLNYICFDHYLYPRKPEDETAMVNRYHDNFRVVSDACRASGRQLCFWAQVSTPPWKIEFGYTRTNQMRYQAFTALAYGARMICWGCYAGGWWTNRVLTATGEKTVLYDRLKTVNHEVRRLQSAYDRLRWLGTTRVRGRSLDAGCFRDVGTEDGAELVVGEFTGRSPDDPARGLLVVAGNDPLDLGRSDVTVRLKCETAVRVFGPEGEMSVDPDASGVLRLRMKPNACALFVTRRTADEDGEDVVRFDLSGRKADDGLFEDLATVSSNCVRTGRRLLCRRNASGDLSVVEKAALALGGDFERTEGEKTLVTMLRDFRPTASSFVPSFSNGYFLDLKAEDGTRLVVGDRVAKDEFARRRALVVFAAGDGSGMGRKMHRITFRVRGQISVFGSQGPLACPAEANGLRSLRLADGELAVILLQNGKAACARTAVELKVMKVPDGRIFSDKECCIDYSACDSRHAQWIAGVGSLPTTTEGFFTDRPNDVLEKRFTLAGPVDKAVWRVAAPGLRDLFVNGVRVSPTALPPWTPYAKRVLEERFDVGAYLKPNAENVLRIELGDGWYNPLPLAYWYGIVIRDVLCVGLPCVRATLEADLKDGGRVEVSTDASWRAAEGRIVRNSLYLGVVEDTRRTLSFDAAAREVAGPPGRILPAEDFPKTVIFKRWTAKSVRPVGDGHWLVDMGVNFTGTIRAHLRGLPSGRRVLFRQGERLNEDGTVNVMTAVAGQIKKPERGPLFAIAEQRDEVIADGRAELVFEPRLTYHVFRYVQVEGLAEAPRAEDFEALAWSADVRETSSFTCSNARLNELHEICRRTFRCNLQSVQSDCPGREKFGYGGDIACTADAFWCNYDMHAFYRKTVRDFLDEAADDGILTETAPYVGIASSGVFPQKDKKARGSAPMGWAVGLPVLLDTVVRYAGDLEILAEAYPTLVRYIALVQDRYPTHDIPECLGDWIPPDENLKADTKLSCLAHWHQFLALTAKFAGLLGHGDDRARFTHLADEVARKFRKDFVKPDGLVGRGVQGDQLFALYHGLLEPQDGSVAEKRLTDDIVRRGDSHMSGIFTIKYLMEYLSTHGEADLVGKVVTHEGEPGWFHMIDRGATTLWEHWNEAACTNVYSNCHPMFGSVDEWMMRHVLGIAVCDDAIGCSRVTIDPKPVAGVTSASGWLDTPKGRLSVSWKLVDGKVIVEKTVPAGITVVGSTGPVPLDSPAIVRASSD